MSLRKASRRTTGLAVSMRFRGRASARTQARASGGMQLSAHRPHVERGVAARAGLAGATRAARVLGTFWRAGDFLGDYMRRVWGALASGALGALRTKLSGWEAFAWDAALQNNFGALLLRPLCGQPHAALMEATAAVVGASPAPPKTAEHALLDCPAYAPLRADTRFAQPLCPAAARRGSARGGLRLGSHTTSKPSRRLCTLASRIACTNPLSTARPQRRAGPSTDTALTA
jgi:hypothetical protein